MAGETLRVQLGGTGRPVSGRLAWPDADDDRPLHVGVNLIRNDEDPAPFIALRDELLPEFREWSTEQKEAFAASDERKELETEINRRLGLTLAPRMVMGFSVRPDGTFRTQGIAPGTYELKVLVQPPPREEGMPPGQPIARHAVRFIVPSLPEGEDYVDWPLDLGRPGVDTDSAGWGRSMTCRAVLDVGAARDRA